MMTHHSDRVTGARRLSVLCMRGLCQALRGSYSHSHVAMIVAFVGVGFVSASQVFGDVTANNDNATATTELATTIDVLANDSSSPNPIDASSVTIFNEPSHGTVTVEAFTGTVNYTSDENYTGTDSFTYFFSDTFGNPSGIATVSIVVEANDPPIIVDFEYTESLVYEFEGLVDDEEIGSLVFEFGGILDDDPFLPDTLVVLQDGSFFFDLGTSYGPGTATITVTDSTGQSDTMSIEVD